MTLKDLFEAQLRVNEEKDDLTRYENYFRGQGAKGVFAPAWIPRRKTVIYNKGQGQGQQ
jgi:hypothetical protein